MLTNLTTQDILIGNTSNNNGNKAVVDLIGAEIAKEAKNKVGNQNHLLKDEAKPVDSDLSNTGSVCISSSVMLYYIFLI